MKKLMFAMVAVALATVANAAPSYAYAIYGAVSKNTADTSPGDSHAKYYTFYAMMQADARTLMGSTKEVSYTDVAAWLGSMYAHGASAQAISAVAANAEQGVSYGWASGYSTYDFWNKKQNYNKPTDNSIGVFFYDDGSTKEFLVMSAGDRGNGIQFDTGNGSKATAWQAPEPTSGLLLLLGVAGLALKRKQK